MAKKKPRSKRPPQPASRDVNQTAKAMVDAIAARTERESPPPRDRKPKG